MICFQIFNIFCNRNTKALWRCAVISDILYNASIIADWNTMVTGTRRSMSKVPHARSSMSHKIVVIVFANLKRLPEWRLLFKWRHMQFWGHSSVRFWHKRDLHHTSYKFCHGINILKMEKKSWTIEKGEEERGQLRRR